ncbi:MAG: anthranilate phosphoribosyltransferase [Thermoleophilia bacterium]|nr:anthranilate phosphoribosyltransferase [Thermoleophilia bacterium]MDH3725751.1 anthranilate phosphoribosyltransferase [Thermoleophilia bacterium]
MPSPVISAAIDSLLAGEDLGRQGAAEALEVIMSGDAGEAQTAGFLIALRAKGESADELAGLASVIRAKAQAVSPEVGDAVDTCGTGGGRSTFNISTTTAFVVAGAGVPVTKHGNRSATSKSGSADVLEAVGARIDLAPDAVAQCLEQSGFCFMFAPLHHPAFKHIVPVRKALAVRTIFNLLGPLTNPAGAKRQLIGVSDPDYLDRIAQALAALGCERGMVVHGRDGMDELSTGAVNDAAVIENGAVTREQIDPAALGFSAPSEGELAGGEPEENAAVMRAVLGGSEGAARDIVVLNAAAALRVAGVADDMRAGVAAGEQSIDSGSAAERLDAYVSATQRLAAAS